MTTPDFIAAAREVCAYADNLDRNGDAIDQRQLSMWIIALRQELLDITDDVALVSRKLIEDAILMCILVHGEKERNEIVTDKALEIAKALKFAIQPPTEPGIPVSIQPDTTTDSTRAKS